MGSPSVATDMAGLHSSLSCFLLIVLDSCQGLSWEKAGVQGELPHGAAVLHPNTNEDYYFCRVGDKVGHLKANDKTCVYPGDGSAATSKTFDVLVAAKDDVLGWKYSKTPPASAVDCNLGNRKELNCYLGQSVYSDGICVEYLGYIEYGPKYGSIYMATRYDEIETCPFFMFLIKE